MKKVLRIMLIFCIAFVFTGCMSSEDTIVIHEDGSGQSTTKIAVDKKAADEGAQAQGMTVGELLTLMGVDPAMTKVETIDGAECYVAETKTTFADYDELKAGLEASGTYQDIYVSADGISFFLETAYTDEMKEEMEASGMNIDEMVSAKMSITMPKEIVMTNGTLSADKKTAVFTLSGDDYFHDLAFVVSTAEENVKPTVNVTNKKVYNKAVTVSVTDASGIKTAKYKKNSGKYYSFSRSKKLTTNGKYTVVVTDYYGNKTVKSFTIKDNKKPTVSGVAQNKTYKSKRTLKFSDNCGVKSATLNGKKISSGKVVSKKGTYKLVVTDVNGLKKVVNFKIK